MKTYQRYLISTLETFIAWFLSTFLLQLEPMLQAGTFPTKELLVSCAIAWIFAGVKALIKYLREELTTNLIK